MHERGAGAARGPADAGSASSGVAREMFETLAPEMSGLEPRAAVQPLARSRRSCERSWRRAASTNAMLRTTTALTIVQRRQQGQRAARPRRGARSTSASCRATRSDSVEAHLRERIGNDAIQVKRYPGNSEPSPVSPTDSAGYRAIERTVRRAASRRRRRAGPDDRRHRFAPLQPGQRRTSTASRRCAPRPKTWRASTAPTSASRSPNYAEMIQFYHQLLRDTAQPQ